MAFKIPAEPLERESGRHGRPRSFAVSAYKVSGDYGLAQIRMDDLLPIGLRTFQDIGTTPHRIWARASWSPPSGK